MLEFFLGVIVGCALTMTQPAFVNSVYAKVRNWFTPKDPPGSPPAHPPGSID